MSNKTKIVSKDYANSEFKTVGLVLILYCLFTLFLPLFLKGILDVKGIERIKGYSSYEVASFLCVLLGTVIPFMFLRRANKVRVRDFFNRTYLSVGEHLSNSVVYFIISAAAIFVTMMALSRFGISGELVSSIGIIISEEHITDLFYVLSFVLLTPVLEEYAFRGVLLSSLSKYGKNFAIIVGSVIYALAHGSFVEMVPSFIMGALLCKVAIKYESIWPTIVMHVSSNLLLYFFFMVPESYSFFMAIAFVLLLIIAIILVITKKYEFIKIKMANNTREVMRTFARVPSIIIACLLFIIHSVLLML
ncbi:MAG: CPBP family intramembrane metalloprotease [Erysipelotrichaceae bacterium]|nr:CPBP family intramembrane metalloprotease [Erysipelotrichaceae bacterium]